MAYDNTIVGDLEKLLHDVKIQREKDLKEYQETRKYHFEVMESMSDELEDVIRKNHTAYYCLVISGILNVIVGAFLIWSNLN